ncbi:hypothetical protein [Nocardia iowensis]|uniref:DUF222 domain-containing protein n=1 Tax=Nocardia iowensis TaxID=204891 RepID=A0ABX8RY64_NOCIO|nr:hypothetical protein [Nocardia iowensis]QXN94597.1 hypothetical protein KV110_17020 [Nocardia iowensis]
MTNPLPPSPPERVSDWRDQLLRSIQQLAAEETRVRRAGYQTSQDPSEDRDRQATFIAKFEDLQRRRAHFEQRALSAGIPAQVIDDVREFGHTGRRPVPRRGAGPRAPGRGDSIEAMCHDMLEVELWDLERMVSLEALRRDRIKTGRWNFGNNPLAVWKFAENTHRQFQRVNALAAGARITATEAATLWSATAEGLRRLHTVTIERLDELSVVAEWSRYAIASPKPARPPYVSDDLDVAKTLADAGVSLPTPQQMLDVAATALRAEFVEATAHHDLGPSAAATEAVNLALPDGPSGWGVEGDDGPSLPEVSHPDPGVDI